MSPLLEVMAVSNGLVTATMVMFAEPVTGPGNGPVGSQAAQNCPGAISGFESCATELLPNGVPRASGSLLSELKSKKTGSVAWQIPMSWLVSGGTSQCGLTFAVIGSGTVTGVWV